MPIAKKETPLMKQYNTIKTKHPGAMLLFRVGDFYETFGEDAIRASKILDIVLTKRANGSASAIELAGFPHHSLDTYLPKLVRAGERVAVCDQLEDPKTVKGIVKRGVTELVTPGVSLHDNVLETKRNNYLCSIYFPKETAKNQPFGVAFLDISTGEFLTARGSEEYIEKLIRGFAPSEIIYAKPKKVHYEEKFQNEFNTYALEDWVYQIDYGYEKLMRHFQTNSLKGFGIENMPESIMACGAILYYLEMTEHHQIKHLSRIARIDEEQYVWLDKFTIKNLELVYPQHDTGVSLVNILDKTVTPQGARLLKKWILLPLKLKDKIEKRHQIVQFFTENNDLTEELISILKPIGDLERLTAKISTARINPREMQQLKKALLHTQKAKEILQKCNPILQKYAQKLHECSELHEKIEKELAQDPPVVTNLGRIIREGIDNELDELRKIAFSGKDFLEQLKEREIKRTGISSLKIAFNKVFGYYLEVRNVHQNKVPPDWIRKQTLVNAERYITEELKEYEEKILTAEDKIHAIEYKIYQELVERCTEFVLDIQQNAQILAMMDVLSAFAMVAIRNDYARPKMTDGNTLNIKNGRHPVIEQQLPIGEKYVPNDVLLDGENQQIIIITGPNMSGKSAILRQTALMVLMAQAGSFVPAKSAEIGITDKVFTRVGASDNLARGESTFMVEMTETASILNNLTDKSLVLMDEIGRGTSTYDGISIAWAIVEHLHNHSRTKTLFATHYHELNQLEADFERVKNYNVAVKEIEDKIIFVRKLEKGGSEHSFGIHVAQLAGMPNSVVIRSQEILNHLEKDKISARNRKLLKEVPKVKYQLSMFEAQDPALKLVQEKLNALDVNTISPVEALLKLNELKNLMGE